MRTTKWILKLCTLSIQPEEVTIIIEDIGNPKLTKRCICLMKNHLSFDSFAIKMCDARGNIVGHLLMEILGITKFLLDCGARMESTLRSTHYRRSLLVQGGLGIPCTVKVSMMPAQLSKKLDDRCRELVESFYF